MLYHIVDCGGESIKEEENLMSRGRIYNLDPAPGISDHETAVAAAYLIEEADRLIDLLKSADHRQLHFRPSGSYLSMANLTKRGGTAGETDPCVSFSGGAFSATSECQVGCTSMGCGETVHPGLPKKNGVSRKKAGVQRYALSVHPRRQTTGKKSDAV